MNKNVYALAVVVFNVLSLQSFSQLAIPNGNFEKFTKPSSTEYAFEGWSSYDFVSPTFTGTADAHGGTMALKVYNDQNDGGQISCKIINKDNNYPVKLKGFIKYLVAPGEKVKISISNTYTTVGSNNQTMHYVEPIGATYFTGTSDGYQPFEITLGYKLANSLFYHNANIGKFEIEILSYDDTRPYGTKISDETYISVDDLTFEGQIASLPRFTTGVPDGLENWVSLNNKLYPEEWTDGLYANQKSYRYFSQSTDAAEGKYALKISLDTTKENYSDSGIKRIIIDNAKKKLSLKMKYNLGLGDSLTLLLTGNRFIPFVKAIQITGVQSVDFKEELVNLTDFADNSICYIGFIFKKASPNTFKTFGAD